MVERSWDQAQNKSNTALLVIMNFPTRSPVRGWTSKITFSKNITDVQFTSVSGLVQACSYHMFKQKRHYEIWI